LGLIIKMIDVKKYLSPEARAKWIKAGHPYVQGKYYNNYSAMPKHPVEFTETEESEELLCIDDSTYYNEEDIDNLIEKLQELKDTSCSVCTYRI
jgi:hypothetical protein